MRYSDHELTNERTGVKLKHLSLCRGGAIKPVFSIVKNADTLIVKEAVLKVQNVRFDTYTETQTHLTSIRSKEMTSSQQKMKQKTIGRECRSSCTP